MTASLAGKNIVMGITGSIAAFKAAGWVSNLVKEEAQVKVVMTENAARFVTPLTFASLSGNSVYTDMFQDGEEPMAHIRLGQEVDLFMAAPATANTIAKLARGMADNLLTASIMAARVPVIICPAMNSAMYSHPATVKNLGKLKRYNYDLVEPDTGTLACGQNGPGRLAKWQAVREIMLKHFSVQDLAGKKIVVTAGPTREAIDPARFISNLSSGKMGYAIAAEAWRRGGEVVLISGKSCLDIPYGVHAVQVGSTEEMYQAVMKHASSYDIMVKTAAVSDFKPAVCRQHKVKKNDAETSLSLERTPDILQELGSMKKAGQILVGFAAESNNHRQEALKKLHKKNLDMIAVNDIIGQDTGFQADNNQLTLLWQDSILDLPHASKTYIAELLWNKIGEVFLS
ncbi:MAG: bifunctional phosphopantothenoylcysteine decarboxylase/phosphopantothenate--cysteine ligase CoaBC [Deltaproteobacteria bacterium]|nr:MAG: bifunctional phosphopantothenoylcysteine decarboxylase/phosphopantothenate--cysteine ligase CoaBC [Deltaproteobacteria bacterium]